MNPEQKPGEGLRIRNMVPGEHEISEYDSLHFPAHRPEFLQRWLEQEDSTALIAPDQSGGIGGYGVIRKCFSGHKTGPLFADSSERAESIFQGLISGMRGSVLIFRNQTGKRF